MYSTRKGNMTEKAFDKTALANRLIHGAIQEDARPVTVAEIKNFAQAQATLIGGLQQQIVNLDVTIGILFEKLGYDKDKIEEVKIELARRVEAITKQMVEAQKASQNTVSLV
jgi:hypothetical protein